MSIIDHIEKLQKKPEKTRKKIFLATLSIIMALIIFLWITMFRAAPDKETANAVPSPLKIFWDTLSKSANDLSKILPDLNSEQ